MGSQLEWKQVFIRQAITFARYLREGREWDFVRSLSNHQCNLWKTRKGFGAPKSCSSARDDEVKFHLSIWESWTHLQKTMWPLNWSARHFYLVMALVCFSQAKVFIVVLVHMKSEGSSCVQIKKVDYGFWKYSLPWFNWTSGKETLNAVRQSNKHYVKSKFLECFCWCWVAYQWQAHLSHVAASQRLYSFCGWINSIRCLKHRSANVHVCLKTIARCLYDHWKRS